MNRHPVPDAESYTMIDDTNTHHGVVTFVNFGPATRWGRGCGVYSCSPAEVPANIAALKQMGRRVFRAGAEL